jgi:hypothetical protein
MHKDLDARDVSNETEKSMHLDGYYPARWILSCFSKLSYIFTATRVTYFRASLPKYFVEPNELDGRHEPVLKWLEGR